MSEVKQSKLIEKFIVYHDKTRTIPLTEEMKALLRKGICFGLSVSHGSRSVDVNGLLTPWQTALQAIANWDENIESLHCPIDIPGFGPTLGDLFNTVFFENVFKYHSAKICTLFNIEQSIIHSQTEVLKENSFFSLQSTTNESLRVIDSLSAVVMPLEGILKRLSPLFFQDVFCIVQIRYHACSLRKYNDDWYLYNPSFKNGERKFTTEELAGKLANDNYYVGMEFVSFTEKFPLPFKELCGRLNTTATCVNLERLKLLGKSSPHDLLSLVEEAKTNICFRESLRRSLNRKDIRGLTGAHFIIKYSPKSILCLIDIAKDDELFRKELAFILKGGVGKLISKNLRSTDTGRVYLNMLVKCIDPKKNKWPLLFTADQSQVDSSSARSHPFVLKSQI